MKPTLLPVAVCLFAVSTLARAEESGPRREGESRELMQKAGKARAEGRLDEARELAQKAGQLRGGPEHKPEGPPRRPEGAQPSGPGRDGAMSERLANVRKQAEELDRAGKHEEAEKLRKSLAEKLHAVREHGEHHEGRAMPGENVRKEIVELHRAGKHDEAKKLISQYRDKMKGEHSRLGGGPSHEAEGAARLRHLVEAIKELRKAGINEPAESLEKMARKMHDDLEAQHRAQAEQQPSEEGHRRHPNPPAPNAEGGSRRPSGPGPNAEGGPRRPEGSGPNAEGGPRRPGASGSGEPMQAIQQQLQKMSHAIEELQTQVRQLRGGDHPPERK